jgi:hypothetical protein
MTFSTVPMAWPITLPTAPPSFLARRTEALGFAFFATFLTVRLAAEAVLVAFFLRWRAAVAVWRFKLFPLLTTFFPEVASFEVRLIVM